MIEERPMTPQEVADTLRIAKNTVYELIKRGELRAYKVGNKFRFNPRDVEAYKSGSSPQESDAPLITAAPAESAAAPQSRQGSGFILCGQDILLDLLAQRLESNPKGGRVFRSYLGSYNGLYALYQRSVNAATAHLWDSRTDSYNLPFLPYVLPGTPVVVVHLALRTVGFYVPAGNPKGLGSWADLARTDLTLVNRERGSGIRVLLDERLRLLGIPTRHVAGYGRACTTHLAAASAVARGGGDYALGNEKSGRQVNGIDFIPLQEERYELVFLKDDLGQPMFQALMEAVQSPSFRQELEGLGGYGTRETGKIMEFDIDRG
jgi:putative molybdopterin biosynthesis protein